ncbi:MAG: Gfo/Idh/MocA family oxidoreductase [Sphaerochaetaceae bacterium]|nr:Gfo/Idh/MocA family oxidoreductase [Sphaerochaetaceae bacterium]
MIRYGMVGGGPNAFIGDVHRTAIRMNNDAQLVAGCFSRDYNKSLKFGQSLNIDEDRLYSDFKEMAEKEAARDDGIQFVVCVTPNISHYEVCKAFLEAGINVVCDKPLTWTTKQSEELIKIQHKNSLLFGVTYTYTGYPAVKEMRNLVQKGEIGKLRFVNAEYPQGWLSEPIDENSKLAPWRMDPKISGATNCLGDIGTHIENLVSFVTGLKISKVCARLDSLVEGRTLDDNASILVDYEGGAKGIYWSSQIAQGYDNAVRIRVFGEKGSLEWVQEDPDHFIFTTNDCAKRIVSRGRDEFDPSAQKYSRLPAGHQEGIYEAFANIYKGYISALKKSLNNEIVDEKTVDYPTAQMGLDGVKYVEKCLLSNEKGSVWISME